MGTDSDRPDIPAALWIVLGAVILITAAVTLPRVIAHARSFSAVVQQQGSSPQETAQTPEVHRALVKFHQGALQAEVTPAAVPACEHAETQYDRLLTALLSPPMLDELSRGFLSLIPPGTEYIGSRMVRGTLYVELSENFFREHPLGEAGMEAALGQITETLMTEAQISQYVLIHDGEIRFGPVRMR